jgi:hypothetical protein
MINQIDLTNHTSGKLIAHWPAGYKAVGTNGKQRRIMWLCSCACGNTCLVDVGSFSSKHTKTCGCSSHVKHGLSFKGKVTPEYHLWVSAHARSKDKKIPFNIEPKDIIIPTTCPLLGIVLFKNGKRGNPTSPSVDRIIPSLGYVKGNIWVISVKANIAKSNLSIEEFRYLLHHWEAKMNEDFIL